VAVVLKINQIKSKVSERNLFFGRVLVEISSMANVLKGS
jgi:hypothetical protein